MLALSIRQSYAELIPRGIKTVEYQVSVLELHLIASLPNSSWQSKIAISSSEIVDQAIPHSPRRAKSPASDGESAA